MLLPKSRNVAESEECFRDQLRSLPFHVDDEIPNLVAQWNAYCNCLGCRLHPVNAYVNEGSSPIHVDSRRNLVAGHVSYCSRTGIGLHHSLGIFFVAPDQMLFGFANHLCPTVVPRNLGQSTNPFL
ncbi:hypothetical protein VNO77_24519 [Canavalia gladiata]|uniref:Uncharacterized protein n=1 Tax=Canavalia gladiata TaxID=3824 RepID=A0AAN9L6Y8_CANGL